jgi:hypothetical protein
MSSKQKYLACSRSHKAALAFEWNNLPDEITDYIDPDLIYNVLSCQGTGEINEKSVIYFRPVRKFSDDVTVFETDNIEFGVD